MKSVFVLVLCFLAICEVEMLRSCQNPSSYYGKSIAHARAYSCGSSGGAQCVAAVFQLCNAPNTGSWRPGLKVTDNCKKVPVNTAIASFSGAGNKYNGNNGHAAIFLGCTSDGSLKVADQWCGHAFSTRTLQKNCSTKPYSNCANYFYTIEW